MLVFKKSGKREIMESIELSNQESIETLERKKIIYTCEYWEWILSNKQR